MEPRSEFNRARVSDAFSSPRRPESLTMRFLLARSTISCVNCDLVGDVVAGICIHRKARLTGFRDALFNKGLQSIGPI